MATNAGLIGVFENGVGYVAAKTYGASWNQAFVFSTVNMIVSRILRRLISTYLRDTRQYALADISIQAASGLTGVLMTCLFCKKMIYWKPALAASVISDAAVIYAIPLFTKPMPLSSFSV
jgi:hypothetical protein